MSLPTIDELYDMLTERTQTLIDTGLEQSNKDHQLGQERGKQYRERTAAEAECENQVHIANKAAFVASMRLGEVRDMIDTGANGMVQNEKYKYDFDYLKGRVMKVNLSGDTLNEWGYDRDNGTGAAERAIASLRKA